MRVSLLTYSTKPRGGVVHTLNLAEALAQLGADVTVWSLARGGDPGFFREVDPAVTVRLARFDDFDGDTVTDRIVRSIEVLGNEFDRGAADIVHAQDCISANAVGRCIRTIHHLDQFTTPILASCHEKAITLPYARICVSSAVADEVHLGWGFEPTVIPNGVQADRFAGAATAAPDAVAARALWEHRLGRYVLAVGGIEPRKGSIDLLEAYALMRRDDPELALVFAGGDTLFDYRGYRADFDRRAVELGIEPIVLGQVDDNQLPALVAQAAVFAFPSTKEGFGLAAMEALAAGVPVVARDLPVLHEVFGGSVRYARTPADLATEMNAAMVTDSVRVALGREVADSLTWEAAARAHLDFYREVGA
ncbi:MSMEG_0565 family glycosyltransferase [Williamsia sp. 1135]|uniref:MSMEG_0565 family glycosyltransferase n=1 Tax=Williamsia sp. 1135 TaxID=1889262 RepID=UPI000A1103D5|nr:MSMEG_0565 family glycosyltransferase [Williamsia sp. 1135]ORM26945.1 glycosyl transferase family 1 [Williamsia sp. 1135]